MERRVGIIVAFALGLALFLAVQALGREDFPALSGRVVDEADLFSPAEEEELSRVLEEFEAATTNQFVVVTLPSLGGAEIKQYAAELGHYWGLGQKGKDNGAVLLVAVDDHKVTIQAGYGLEEKLTDGTCGEIIREEITPFFKEGDYYAGVRAGLADPRLGPDPVADLRLTAVTGGIGHVFERDRWLLAVNATAGVSFNGLMADPTAGTP
ncbi:MAG: TPM domain-containing protein, partial [Firmicutes bacterium]|nr:TPM domain-containing protein [Bacillota bacterium]